MPRSNTLKPREFRGALGNPAVESTDHGPRARVPAKRRASRLSEDSMAFCDRRVCGGQIYQGTIKIHPRILHPSFVRIQAKDRLTKHLTACCCVSICRQEGFSKRQRTTRTFCFLRRHTQQLKRNSAPDFTYQSPTKLGVPEPTKSTIGGSVSPPCSYAVDSVRRSVV